MGCANPARHSAEHPRFPLGLLLADEHGSARGAEVERNYMPNNSIYLDSGVWRREQPNEKDPLRVFPELFNANTSTTRAATNNSEAAPVFEVAETTDGFLLSARVPGITAAELQVRVTAQLVIVVRKPVKGAAVVSAGGPNLSLAHAAFRKAFVLPTAVDARRLNVAIEGERLTIKLPKRVSAQTLRPAQTTR